MNLWRRFHAIWRNVVNKKRLFTVDAVLLSVALISLLIPMNLLGQSLYDLAGQIEREMNGVLPKDKALIEGNGLHLSNIIIGRDSWISWRVTTTFGDELRVLVAKGKVNVNSDKIQMEKSTVSTFSNAVRENFEVLLDSGDLGIPSLQLADLSISGQGGEWWFFTAERGRQMLKVDLWSPDYLAQEAKLETVITQDDIRIIKALVELDKLVQERARVTN